MGNGTPCSRFEQSLVLKGGVTTGEPGADGDWGNATGGDDAGPGDNDFIFATRIPHDSCSVMSNLHFRQILP